MCSHEHYVPLNLPLAGAGGPGAGGGAPAGVSPAASWQSLGSHSSHALGHEFRSRHYLAGLLLSELTSALELQSVSFWLLPLSPKRTAVDRDYYLISIIIVTSSLLNIIINYHQLYKLS